MGIRFELGIEWNREYDFKDSLYLLGVYKRAITLFNSLHSPNEKILVVIDVDDFGDGQKYNHKASLFSPYIYEKSTL